MPVGWERLRPVRSSRRRSRYGRCCGGRATSRPRWRWPRARRTTCAACPAGCRIRRRAEPGPVRGQPGRPWRRRPARWRAGRRSGPARTGPTRGGRVREPGLAQRGRSLVEARVGLAERRPGMEAEPIAAPDPAGLPRVRPHRRRAHRGCPRWSWTLGAGCGGRAGMPRVLRIGCYRSPLRRVQAGRSAHPLRTCRRGFPQDDVAEAPRRRSVAERSGKVTSPRWLRRCISRVVHSGYWRRSAGARRPGLRLERRSPRRFRGGCGGTEAAEAAARRGAGGGGGERGMAVAVAVPGAVRRAWVSCVNSATVERPNAGVEAQPLRAAPLIRVDVAAVASRAREASRGYGGHSAVDMNDYLVDANRRLRLLPKVRDVAGEVHSSPVRPSRYRKDGDSNG